MSNKVPVFLDADSYERRIIFEKEQTTWVTPWCPSLSGGSYFEKMELCPWVTWAPLYKFT